ncbi:MAG: RNA 2',3'-cyclic phosphodiesterase [Candidatus Neomarinimicrobiota bacterium]|nr:RNA 2',3'-cyclic phosphodiesterase [Candidatus Neomarinimicrobiota bacterium]
MYNKRIFIGIPIKLNLKMIVDMMKTTVSAPYGNLKWVYGKNLHLTLSYLGNLDDQMINKIQEKIELVDFGKAFNAEINHTGVFPDSVSPNSFWLGFGEGSDNFRIISGKIKSILEELNIPSDNREFIPHIVIGKVQNKKELWKINVNSYLNTVFSPTKFYVNSIHLYESEKTDQGIKYTSIVSKRL